MNNCFGLHVSQKQHVTHTVCFVLVTNAKYSVSAVARKHKYFFPLHAWVADVVVSGNQHDQSMDKI